MSKHVRREAVAWQADMVLVCSGTMAKAVGL